MFAQGNPSGSWQDAELYGAEFFVHSSRIVISAFLSCVGPKTRTTKMPEETPVKTDECLLCLFSLIPLNA